MFNSADGSCDVAGQRLSFFIDGGFVGHIDAGRSIAFELPEGLHVFRVEVTGTGRVIQSGYRMTVYGDDWWFAWGCLDGTWPGPETDSDEAQRFQGEWFSPRYGYAFDITGRSGYATIANAQDVFQIDEEILRISRIESNRFWGVQIFTDGRWYEVTGELNSSGELELVGGGYRWTMIRSN